MNLSRDAEVRSDTFDLVVVGGGAGGMTAALVAALEGLRVVLCEGAQQLGGTTATSAGTLWIPGNRHGRKAGHADSIEDAQRYLESLIGPDDERGCRSAFLETGDAAIAYLEERTDVAFVSAGLHPDYLERPGAATAGRALAPKPFDGRLLGEQFDRVRPPIPEFLLLGGMMVGKADIQALLQRYRSWPHFLQSASLVARYALDRLRYRRGTRLVMGNALVARLYASVIKAGVDVRFGRKLKDLDRHEGRIAGASFSVNGKVERLACTRGVVLATGGVGHSESLRKELAPQGPAFPSLACTGVAGDGIAAGRRAGARIERHAAGDFFWQPVSRVPRKGGGEGLFPHLFLDRAKPGLVAVDVRGERFVNEASSYHHFVAGLRQRELAIGRGGAWLICDAGFVRRYGLGVIPPGTKNLRAWRERGYVTVADSLQELAVHVGIDPQGLARTVERSNADALSGNDTEFRKGIAPLDRFNADASHRPNPCLGAISNPPFIALRIGAADAASSSGLATDRDGRVMNDGGDVVHGLYACGNDAASVMRGTYPGPGTTLGPAVVFGYRVAMHARSQSR